MGFAKTVSAQRYRNWERSHLIIMHSAVSYSHHSVTWGSTFNILFFCYAKIITYFPKELKINLVNFFKAANFLAEI